MTREQTSRAEDEAQALIEAKRILAGADITLSINHLRALDSCLRAQDQAIAELRRAMFTKVEPLPVMA